MATTAADIITEAVENLGVLGAGETLAGDESTAALRGLNTLIDGLRADRAAVYRIQDEQFTLPAGSATRTIGPTGQFNTTRPVRIEWAFVRFQGYDYPLRQLAAKSWAEAPDKSLAQTWPAQFWYEPAAPLGVIHFVPVPNDTFELHLGTWSELSGFANINTAVELPPGYKAMLVSQLTWALAPKYERDPANYERLANLALSRVKRINHEPLVPVASEVALVASRRGAVSDIFSGGV